MAMDDFEKERQRKIGRLKASRMEKNEERTEYKTERQKKVSYRPTKYMFFNRQKGR